MNRTTALVFLLLFLVTTAGSVLPRLAEQNVVEADIQDRDDPMATTFAIYQGSWPATSSSASRTCAAAGGTVRRAPRGAPLV